MFFLFKNAYFKYELKNGDKKLLVAYDHKNNLVLAQNANADTQYFCPACQQIVIKRAGTYKVAHYAHQTVCPISEENTGETSEHLNGKLQLQQFFAKYYQTKLEVYFPQIKQRADLVLINGQRQIVIEYQCSPLSIEKLRKRTAGYEKSGLSVVWILGQRYFKRLAKDSILAKFGTLVKDKLVVLAWDTDTKELKIVASLGKCDFKKLPTIMRQAKSYSDYQVIIKMLNDLQVNPVIKAKQRYQQALKWAQFVYTKLQGNQLKQLAYMNSCLLEGAPWLIHAKLKIRGGLSQLHAEWRCENLIYLQQYQLGQVFKITELKKVWLRKDNWWPMTNAALFEQHSILSELLIEDLVAQGILYRNSPNQVTYIRKPHWFKNIDEKLESFKN